MKFRLDTLADILQIVCRHGLKSMNSMLITQSYSQLQREAEFTDQRSSRVKLHVPVNLKSLKRTTWNNYDQPQALWCG